MEEHSVKHDEASDGPMAMGYTTIEGTDLVNVYCATRATVHKNSLTDPKKAIEVARMIYMSSAEEAVARLAALLYVAPTFEERKPFEKVIERAAVALYPLEQS